MTATTVDERRYTIRYRCRGRGGQTGLIIEDGQGQAYLFGGGQLQGRLRGQGAAERLASALGKRSGVFRVPRVRPYTFAALRQLVGAPTPGRERLVRRPRLTA